MRALHLILMILVAMTLAACGAQPAAQKSAGEVGHDDASGANHDHSGDGPALYDAQFIDDMTIHHQGAVAMAKQALTESQRPEIKQMAQTIIATQNQEIEQMAAWRKAWYPDLPAIGGTGGHMGDMELSSDRSIPFDQRFITAMIGHHNGAIEMAKEAQSKAEHQEIKQLAGAIIQAQEAEVKQLQGWQAAWFGQ